MDLLGDLPTHSNPSRARSWRARIPYRKAFCLGQSEVGAVPSDWTLGGFRNASTSRTTGVEAIPGEVIYSRFRKKHLWGHAYGL